MHSVLLIEGCLPIIRFFKTALSHKKVSIDLTLATTFAEAEAVIRKAGEEGTVYDFIIVAGKLNAGQNSIPLIWLLTELKIGKRIIAVSTNESTRERQIKAGCTESCEKRDLVNNLFL